MQSERDVPEEHSRAREREPSLELRKADGFTEPLLPTRSLKNSHHLGDRLGILIRAVIRRHKHARHIGSWNTSRNQRDVQRYLSVHAFAGHSGRKSNSRIAVTAASGTPLTRIARFTIQAAL